MENRTMVWGVQDPPEGLLKLHPILSLFLPPLQGQTCCPPSHFLSVDRRRFPLLCIGQAYRGASPAPQDADKEGRQEEPQAQQAL